MKNADNVTYYGTVLDDEVKFNLDNISDSITIDSGGGDDVLDISVRQSPSVSISLTKGGGFNADTGDLTDEGKQLVKNKISELFGTGGGDSNDSRLQIVIDGGNGDDEITITLINSTDISATTGEQPENAPPTLPDGVTFDLDLSATDLTVNGGSGIDTITVKGGMELGLPTTILQPIIQAMLDYIPQAADLVGIPGTQIKINGGEGDDLINVDTTTSFSSFRGVKVTVDGGDGYDRVNFTGKLEKYEDNNNNISGNASKVQMSTLAEISILNDAAAISKLKSNLTVNMDNLEAVTDELANKKTVIIDDLLSNIVFESFTNYVIDGDSGNVNDENDSGNGTFLTNLIVEGSNITIEKLVAPHVNIIISAEDSSLNQSGSIYIIGEKHFGQGSEH